MGHITFLFGVHDHQPVGNFDWVFKDSYEKCYKPFLDILEKHPKVRCAMHHTGPLLEWIEENRPKYFEKLAKMVQRNQIELLGGAFYEPILTIIPEKDAVGQIQMMSKYLQEKFGVTPKGMWLAERVWEPHLPAIVRKAGIEYTLLDDTHFAFSGLHPEDMVGYYITEHAGITLAVFPIDKTLRYSIPFKLPEETIRYLGSISVEEGTKAVSMSDDGEKFGIWPGTHDWVYNQGYLEKLFGMLDENSSWIHMQTYSEYLANNKPTGRVYLPTASYYEMMEWSLPTRAGMEYQAMIKTLTQSNLYENYKVFLRGGFWRNFLVKYKESHLMHSKMCWVSNMVQSALKGQESPHGALKEAQKYLWRGQCNCPYWHGLFGGIYLNYLRYAIYNNLLLAETACDKALHGEKNWVKAEFADYDKDGLDEVLLSSGPANAYIDIDYGGALIEWDCKAKHFNVTDAFTRRQEAYHGKILEAHQQHGGGGQPKSIHDVNHVKENGLENILHYDWYQRHSFIDHFLGQGTTLDNFKACQFPEEGDFANQPYTLQAKEIKDSWVRIALRRNGHLFRPGQKTPVQIDKLYSMTNKGILTVTYSIQNQAAVPMDMWFGTELNLTLLAGSEANRYYVLGNAGKSKMNSQGISADIQTVALVDEYFKMRVELTLSPGAAVWRFPIETASQSESGFEKTYQGSCVLLNWKFLLKPQEKKTLEITGQFTDLS